MGLNSTGGIDVCLFSSMYMRDKTDSSHRRVVKLLFINTIPLCGVIVNILYYIFMANAIYNVLFLNYILCNVLMNSCDFPKIRKAPLKEIKFRQAVIR